MYTRLFILITFILFAFTACKKEANVPKEEQPDPEDSPTILYKTLNRKLKASDVEAMSLDVNEDGVIDYSYFMQYVVMSGTVRLYAGVNPVFGNATMANAQNDNEFLNMGTVHSFAAKSPIKNSLYWTEDHSALSIRYETSSGNNRTYAGEWGSGQEKIMSLRLLIKGKIYYGWARLKFDKESEELTLIDVAWNTIADEEIKAEAR